MLSIYKKKFQAGKKFTMFYAAMQSSQDKKNNPQDAINVWLIQQEEREGHRT
jgi:hypothetical protein